MSLESQRKGRVPIWRRDGSERMEALGKGWVDSHALAIGTDSSRLAVPALCLQDCRAGSRWHPLVLGGWCRPHSIAHIPRVEPDRTGMDSMLGCKGKARSLGAFSPSLKPLSPSPPSHSNCFYLLFWFSLR